MATATAYDDNPPARRGSTAGGTSAQPGESVDERAARVASYEEFYDTYFRDVRAFARRFGHAEADDIAQETMLRAYQHFGELKVDRSVLRWLYTVAYRIGVDQARHQRILAVDHATLDRLAEPGLDVCMEAGVRWDTNRRLTRVLRRLNPADRQVLTLRELQDRSIAEIAVLTGLTANAVRQRLFRARRSLARELRHLGERVPALHPTAWPVLQKLSPPLRRACGVAERCLPDRMAERTTAAVAMTVATLVAPQVPTAPAPGEPPGRSDRQVSVQLAPPSRSVARSLTPLVSSPRGAVPPAGTRLGPADLPAVPDVWRHEAESGEPDLVCGTPPQRMPVEDEAVRFPAAGCGLAFPLTRAASTLVAIRARVDEPACGWFQVLIGDTEIGVTAELCGRDGTGWRTVEVRSGAPSEILAGDPIRIVWRSEVAGYGARVDWVESGSGTRPYPTLGVTGLADCALSRSCRLAGTSVPLLERQAG